MAEIFDQISLEQLSSLASSPAGRQLMAMLRRSGGQELQQASAKASAGDLAGARAMLEPILADPAIRAILAKLGGG